MPPCTPLANTASTSLSFFGEAKSFSAWRRSLSELNALLARLAHPIHGGLILGSFEAIANTTQHNAPGV